MKHIRLVGLVFGCIGLDCTAEDTLNIALQNPHGSVVNPSENTLNSLTTGLGSAGLTGGLDTSRQSDVPGAPLPSGSGC